ncbi:hypothetical protein [uncultured Mediterranean phage uvMED]|nr:hypothetical protein [uncultured Mediterranean phage uvMED]
MSNNITDILLEEDKRDIYFYIDKHIKKKYRFFLQKKLRQHKLSSKTDKLFVQVIEQELDSLETNI